MSTSALLTRVTASPPFVRYVPRPDVSSDSESEGWGVFGPDGFVEDSPPRPSSFDNSRTTAIRTRRDLQEDDIAKLDHENLKDQEPPHFNLPTLQDEPRRARKAIPPDYRSREASGTSIGAPKYVDRVSYSDWNIRILIGNNSFKLHEHQLNKFSVLEKLIQTAYNSRPEAGAGTELELLLNDENPTDFQNMIGILYLTVCEGVADDDHSIPVLKSTLRIATKYEYEHMREYAIQCLEKRDLTPIERIELARECNVLSWSKEALDELCARDELITRAEADILGLGTFFELASRREALRLKRKPNRQSPSKTKYSKPGTAERSEQSNSNPNYSKEIL
ncbi:unnamed protein product [Rhizoctonia solani]|uniref:BTB domain-containing protein n=1 Tax=Rhizoctonia solani TaxID=456999 RepID=A0A8H2XG00_9AGAM|nr:unnamed protein product [Rhizoctonia solani]